MEILIVDSSLQIIKRLEELLSEAKNIKTIHRVVSYAQASAFFNTGIPDVVLLDTGLPGNKSVDLLKEIKAANTKTAVIVLSIHIDELTMKKHISAGADYFLDKYHEFEKIPVIIKNIADNKKGPDY